MGRHRENITRLVCGVMSIAVSLCLLTCAFFNTAYAVTANADLPNTDSDINGGSYNPTGYLFGTDGNVFTDTWYSDESIFFQTLSGTFQLVQDKSAIYTAVVADLVRQGNNLTAKTNYWLSSISNKFTTLLNDTGNILFDLRYNSYSVNGTTTKTIRGLVNDISDAMTTNNASLQQIKDEFRDSNNSSYLAQIRSGTNSLPNIYAQLANGTSGTISGTVNSINSKIATINGNVSLILDALSSGGYIGQQLADLNATLTTIKNNTAPYVYNDSNGGSVRYIWVSVLKPSDGQAQEWMNNVRNYIDNIRNYSANISSKIDIINSNISSIADSLGSGGYLGQQISLLNTRVLDIYNALTRIQSSWTNNNGGTIWYLRALPLMVNDPSSTTWGTNVRDYLQQIAQKSTYVDLSDISNALSSNGYIGQQLALLNTRVLDIYNALTRIQSSWTGENGGILWYIRAMPVAALDPYTTTWVSDVRNYLQTIANKPNIDMTSTVNKLNDILLAIQGLDLVFNVPNNWPDIIGDFDDLDFGEKVDDLIDELENLAPFGAIFLISNQINLLTQVDPLTDPSFVMDFNFAGTSENLTLDVSWLNDAKPLFNFITIFLLMYSLLIISMKYVRQEATS